MLSIIGIIIAIIGFLPLLFVIAAGVLNKKTQNDYEENEMYYRHYNEEFEQFIYCKNCGAAMPLSNEKDILVKRNDKFICRCPNCNKITTFFLE